MTGLGGRSSGGRAASLGRCEATNGRAWRLEPPERSAATRPERLAARITARPGPRRTPPGAQGLCATHGSAREHSPGASAGSGLALPHPAGPGLAPRIAGSFGGFCRLGSRTLASGPHCVCRPRRRIPSQLARRVGRGCRTHCLLSSSRSLRCSPVSSPWSSRSAGEPCSPAWGRPCSIRSLQARGLEV
jgi:hypothetical protein